MLWADLEKAFARALRLSFSPSKAMLTFPALVLCGLIFVFCRALALHRGEWASMTFGFLPFLLSSGVWLALGVLLVRLHDHESRQTPLSIRDLIQCSADLLIGTVYFSLVPLLISLCFWVSLGLFFLLQTIPFAGNLLSILFSFGPFLLIFFVLLLCCVNVAILFFATPLIALPSVQKTSLLKRLASLLKNRLLSACFLFSTALFPLLLTGGLLCTAAALTRLSFLIETQVFGFAIEWFLIMLPCSAIATPAVIFFFNFATESYRLLQTPEREG